MATLPCAALLAAGAGLAQEPAPPPASPIYTPVQLDQMLAPIALYPDELLGQILTAATYPLEIVQADRWLQVPGNAALGGDALAQSLAQVSWDPSVKALVAFPQILAMLDNNLDWTEQLGDAFLAQQPDVMDSVQRLRARAQAAGTLVPSPQQIVTGGDQGIGIAPANPGQVYVPVYDPQVAYGYWPYPDYPPYYCYFPGYAFGTYIGFVIFAPYWGWHHWDWPHHHLDIDAGAGYPRTGKHLPERPIPWRHDPEHRAGVPYRDDATRGRVLGNAEDDSRRSRYRGYPSAGARLVPPTNGHESRPDTHRDARADARTDVQPDRRPGLRPEVRPEARPGRVPAPADQAPSRRQPPAQPAPIVRQPEPAPFVRAPRPAEPVYRAAPSPAPPPAAPRPPPAMESFGHGPQVSSQEQRGASSRQTPPAPSGRVHR
jgi:hypothetical protein